MAAPTPRHVRPALARPRTSRASDVTVLDRQRKRRVNGARLQRVIEGAATALKASGGEVVIVLARDALLRQLNRAYRGKDAATDVLAFEGGEGADALGDIVISIDAAERNANGAGHSLADELDILVLHGWLHLLGYDHESDQGAMTRIERRLRRQVLQAGRSARP